MVAQQQYMQAVHAPSWAHPHHTSHVCMKLGLLPAPYGPWDLPAAFAVDALAQEPPHLRQAVRRMSVSAVRGSAGRQAASCSQHAHTLLVSAHQYSIIVCPVLGLSAARETIAEGMGCSAETCQAGQAPTSISNLQLQDRQEEEQLSSTTETHTDRSLLAHLVSSKEAFPEVLLLLLTTYQQLQQQSSWDRQAKRDLTSWDSSSCCVSS
jgi:hypothetical protein